MTENTKANAVVRRARNRRAMTILAMLAATSIVLTSCGKSSSTVSDAQLPEVTTQGKAEVTTPVENAPVDTVADTTVPEETTADAAVTTAKGSGTSIINASDSSGKRDVAALRKKNADVVGYVYIPGTKIDEPVMQTMLAKYNDAHYYYERDFNKKASKDGSIYATPLDEITATDPGPTNLILYGHNMASGKMFANVHYYKDGGKNAVSYYQKHPLIYVDTIARKATFKIFAVFMADTDSSAGLASNFELTYHQKVNFTSESDFNSYLKEIRDRSYLDIPAVDVKYGDQLVMLSTCASRTREMEDGKIVLVGRMVREGESDEVDTSTAALNTDKVMPARYVKIHG